MIHYLLKKKVLYYVRHSGEAMHTEEESSIIWDLAWESIRPNGYALEIGSWKGSSAYIIASVCKAKKAHLICVDTFSTDNIASGLTDIDFFKDNIMEYLRGLPVSYLMLDSLKAHKLLVDHSFDFCFVDGDHTEPVISCDVQNYYPKVRIGGIYSGHDYGFVHPNKRIKFKVKESVDKYLGKVEVKSSIWIKRVK